jgi:hypothetical protein
MIWMLSFQCFCHPCKNTTVRSSPVGSAIFSGRVGIPTHSYSFRIIAIHCKAVIIPCASIKLTLVSVDRPTNAFVTINLNSKIKGDGSKTTKIVRHPHSILAFWMLNELYYVPIFPFWNTLHGKNVELRMIPRKWYTSDTQLSLSPFTGPVTIGRCRAVRSFESRLSFLGADVWTTQKVFWITNV